MKMTIKTLLTGISAASILVLAGCGSSAVEYEQAARDGGQGYEETQLGDNRYRVTFTGDANDETDRVKDFALLRAAELTLLENHDWFEVVGRETDRQVDREPSARTTVHSGTRVSRNCGLLGCSTTTSPAYTSISVGTNRATGRLTSSIEIVMGSGEAPNPNSVYNASELRSFIEGKY